MSTSVIKKMISRYNRSRLRTIMRGYRMIKKDGKLGVINELKDILVSESFNRIDSVASNWMFGASIANSEIAVRQYLLTRILDINFNKAVLYAIGANKPVSYPLPTEWQGRLTDHGFRVNMVASHFKWLILLFVYFCYGIYSAIITIKQTIFYRRGSEHRFNAPFSYFDTLQRKNVLLTDDSKNFENIITWYSEWNGKNFEVTELHHDAVGAKDFCFDGRNIRYEPFTKISMPDIKTLAFFVKWLFIAFAISIRDFLLLRWWTFLLFPQFVLAAKLRYATDNMVAKDYLFHNSGWVYRPIWTYEAEKRGARVLFYFYSTNIGWFKADDEYRKFKSGWQISTWPILLVWDKYQDHFIRRSAPLCGKTKIVGPISFSSAVKEIEFNTGASIVAAIFDVQPVRSSIYQILGASQEYYVPKIVIQFLKDVNEILEECYVNILHKRKRDIGSSIHPKYEAVSESLLSNRYVYIDPDLSANYVIKIVNFVISMPFTSTAILAQRQNKPSIYYDPFGDVQREDPAAHGIRIIIGKVELRNWVKSITM